MPGLLVALVGRLSFGLRCVLGLVLGGAIPVAVIFTGASILDAMGSTTWGLRRGVAVFLAVLAAGVIVEAGRSGLRALDHGWRPFLPYPAVATVVLGITHHLAGRL